jgi:uncharacterized membrane protein YdjX (TVP38/TMEM64 family)
LARKFGVKVLELFFSRKQIESVSFLRSTKKLNWITLIVFLIPGTPKDILTYAAGLTRIRLSAFYVISSLARLPSVVSSTLGRRRAAVAGLRDGSSGCWRSRWPSAA